MRNGRKSRAGAIDREKRVARDLLKAEALRAKAVCLSHAHKQALIEEIKDGHASEQAKRNTPFDALPRNKLFEADGYAAA